MICRHCSSEDMFNLVDLGTSPPSNAYIKDENINSEEKWFPLKINICSKCFLCQTEDYSSGEELFAEDYAYFSSFSQTMLDHSKKYSLEMIKKLNLNSNSMVIEVAANDGYLLQYFKEKSIPCIGIEPTSSTANAARKKGIDIIEDFFGVSLANIMIENGQSADLIVGNNVLAHVPNINDFVKGAAILLKESGVVTYEIPYLVNLVKNNLFDTIYHEHYSYLTVNSIKNIFEANGLHLFDVELIDVHGGSLRVFGEKNDNAKKTPLTLRAQKIINNEKLEGFLSEDAYKGFQEKTEKVKNDFVTFLIEAKNMNKKVIGFGAAAKGNTLINFSGIRSDLISAVVDSNPAKQGKYLPGSRIPIINEETMKKEKPDYLIILPWNLQKEIIDKTKYIKDWNGEWVVALPELKIL